LELDLLGATVQIYIASETGGGTGHMQSVHQWTAIARTIASNVRARRTDEEAAVVAGIDVVRRAERFIPDNSTVVEFEFDWIGVSPQQLGSSTGLHALGRRNMPPVHGLVTAGRRKKKR
jgi:hypothetical protein